MNNNELLEKLKNQGSGEEQAVQGDEIFHKYVVFSLGTSTYALPAAEVKEISFDNTLYYIPFVPPYVRGYANRHGQPYTVFDLDILFRNEKLESSTLLVLNLPGDQACLLISDVDEIIKIPARNVHTITSEDESSRYFLESISLKEQEIFVLRGSALLERLERDLER
jgi:chemotaxis signal transduction protein